MHHFKIDRLKFDNQYIIRFKGLKEGIHNFKFAINKEFFMKFDALEARDGTVEVIANLIKRSEFLTLDILIKGTVEVQCDRCLEYFNYPIEYSSILVVKFSENSSEQSDDMIILNPNDNELNLTHHIYEFISLAIPYRKIHPESADGKSLCKSDMLQRIREFEVKQDEEAIKTNWEKLKYYFANNN